MVEKISAAQQATPASGSGQKQIRERSRIAFPYHDVDAALDVVKTVYSQSGERCDLDQLAAWMKHDSVDSGTFRVKVGAARIFGLIETDRNRVTLTLLGREAVNPDLERRARTKAFLNVPLYRAIFDRYRGYLLPPPNALERVMGEMGVARKQTDSARQVFQRSAEQAGFFAQGKDRLVLPPETPIADIKAKIDEQTEPIRPREDSSGGGNGSGSLPPSLHPFIAGLLQTLPTPNTEWSAKKREQWLDTARNIFALIYKDSESE